MPVSEELLELLRCPISGQKLHLSVCSEGEETLVSEDDKITYPIRNGLPHLVESEAIQKEE